MQIIDDKKLLNEIKANSIEAFEALYKKYFQLLYTYAKFYLSESQDCEDVVQDIFAYLWKSRSKIEIESSVKAYLYMACQNSCLDLIKRKKNKQRYASKLIDLDENFVDGYERIYESLLKDKLDRAMKQLPEQCRKIFILSRIKGLKHKEIAKHLSLSPKTVEVQIYRALKLLKKSILTGMIFFFDFLFKIM